jgi:hypothetical protein
MSLNVDQRPTIEPPDRFRAAGGWLSRLSEAEAASLIAAAADVTLVLDDDGVITDLAFGSEELSHEGYAAGWASPWMDTVTRESRAKVEASCVMPPEALATLAAYQSSDRPRRRRAGAVCDPPDGERTGRRTRVAICAASPCSVAWWRRSRPWSASTRACAAPRPATACCSRSPRNRCHCRCRQRPHHRGQSRGRQAARTVKTRELVGQELAGAVRSRGARTVSGLLARVQGGAAPTTSWCHPRRGPRESRLAASVFRQEKASYLLVRLARPKPAPTVPARRHGLHLADAGRAGARRLRGHGPGRQYPDGQFGPSWNSRRCPLRSSSAANRWSLAGQARCRSEHAARDLARARPRCACSPPRCTASIGSVVDVEISAVAVTAVNSLPRLHAA